MSSKVTIGYPTPGKAKAKLILEAFCAGANGKVADSHVSLLPGPASFYGVVPETKHLWKAAKREGRDVYYIDNAYFDSAREVYFRVTRNRLQHPGYGESDGKRFASLNIPIQPWRESGTHVLVCPQSVQFMRDVAEYQGDWLKDTLTALKLLTDRPVRVRAWSGNKKEWFRGLPEDLKDCHCLVSYSSSSSITALLSGVPAISTGDDAIARPVTGRLEDVENPPKPSEDERRAWASVAADNQWTLPEMRSGLTWRMLNG